MSTMTASACLTPVNQSVPLGSRPLRVQSPPPPRQKTGRLSACWWGVKYTEIRRLMEDPVRAEDCPANFSARSLLFP